MSNVKTRSCPKCGFNLVFEDINKPVFCECCEQTIAWDTDRNAVASNDDSVASSSSMSMAVPAMMGFDNPESGVVFLENFFDNYNWIPYMINPDIKVREIAEVVNNNKMKNGACAISWYLDYKALAYPVRKKIEGLAKHQKEMADIYNPVDPTASLALFDSYQRVCRALVKGKKDIFKQLDNAIKYAEKFNLDADKMSEMKNDYESLKAAFEKDVVLVKDISEIPVYAEAKKAASKKIAEELNAKGIDVEGVYKQALSLYNDPVMQTRIASLALFEKVRGYEDSVQMIQKINQYFNYHNELYRAFGAHFIYKQEEYKPTALDVKNLGKSIKGKKSKEAASEEAAPASVKAWSLFEVVDGKPAKESSVQGIDKLITCYGGRLYYFKKDEGIYSYDITTHAEAALCKGKDNVFKNEKGEYEYRIATTGSTFFVKKLITKEEPEEETGCAKMLSKFKKKAPVAPEDDLNLHCVVMVDMKNNTCKPIINKLTSIAEAHENKIFYTVREKQKPVKMGCVDKLKGKKAKEPEIITRLMVCDADTGACKQALDSSCEIHAVYKDYIIYSIWQPNDWNKDLHSLSLTTGKDVLIERNIYDYFPINAKNEIIDGKIYYTVGNKDYQPLVRNNLDGTERLEILSRVAKVEGERGGYLYIKRGTGVNSALWKISTDGKEKYPLCSQFKKVAKFEDHYVYYQDVYNRLHVMRIDGKEDRVLAENVANVIVSSEGLYYTRIESIDGRKRAFSLYLMDKGGHNIKKVEFNLVSYAEDLKTGIITYAREEKVRFKCYLPGKEDEAAIEHHDITRYYEMDKETGDTKLVLTLGWPEAEEEKKGCLSKLLKSKKPVKKVYEEAPLPYAYEYKGLHPIYEDGNEDLPDTPEEEVIAAVSSALGGAQLPAGCNQLLEKTGCAKIFSKVKSKVNPNNGGKQSAVETKLPSAKAKAKLNTIKVNRAALILGIVAFALTYWGISSLISAFNWNPWYGKISVFAQIILPFLMAIVSGGLAAICFGIIPVGKMKRNLPLTVIYGVLALIFAVTGVVNITNVPGKGETSDKPYTIELDEPKSLKIQEYSSVYCEFYASETATYAFNVSDTEGYIRISLNNGKEEQIIREYGSGTAYFRLLAGNDYSFTVSYYQYYDTDKIELTISKAQDGASASAPIQLSLGEQLTGMVSGSQEVWYEFENDLSMYDNESSYTLTFTADTDVYVYGYRDYKESYGYGETDVSNYDRDSYSDNITWDNIYVTYGDTYLIKVKASGMSANYTICMQLPPNGESADRAFIAPANAETNSFYVSEKNPVWYKYTAKADGEHSFYASAGYELTLTAYNSSMAGLSKSSGNYLAQNTAQTAVVTLDMEEGETVWFKISSYYDTYATFYAATSANGSNQYRAYTVTADATPIEGEMDSDTSETWYKFTPSADGMYTVTAETTSSNDEVALYGYSDLDSSYDIYSYDGTLVSLSWYAEAGNTYWVKVYSYDAPTFTLSVTSAKAITAGVTEEGTVAYESREVWYQYTPAESSQQTISVDADETVYVYVYTDPTSYSSNYNWGTQFELSAYLNEGQTYWIEVEYYSYDTEFALDVTLPANGLSAERAYTIDNAEYTDSKYVNDDVWFKYTAEEDGEHSFTANTYDYEIAVGVYSNPANSAVDTASGYEASVSFEMTAGETYYFLIENDYQQYVYYRVGTPRDGSSAEKAWIATPETTYSDSVGYDSNSVWYEYTATKSGTHIITVDANEYVYLYGYDSNPESYSYDDYDYGTSPSLSWYLSEGSTYWFKVEYYNWSTDFTFYVSLPIDGSSANKAYSLAGGNSSPSSIGIYQSVSASSTNTQWWKFVAPYDGDYQFYLYNASYMSMNGYSDPAYTDYYSQVSISKYLYCGDVYYIEVVGSSSSYTDSDTLYVTGKGLDLTNNYISISSGNTRTITIPAGGYVWLRSSTTMNYYDYFSISSNTSVTASTYYYYYSDYNFVTTSSGTSLSMYGYSYSSYTHALCLYSDVETTVTVYLYT